MERPYKVEAKSNTGGNMIINLFKSKFRSWDKKTIMKYALNGEIKLGEIYKVEKLIISVDETRYSLFLIGRHTWEIDLYYKNKYDLLETEFWIQTRMSVPVDLMIKQKTNPRSTDHLYYNLLDRLLRTELWPHGIYIGSKYESIYGPDKDFGPDKDVDKYKELEKYLGIPQFKKIDYTKFHNDVTFRFL
jgi:hypothetical protein